MRKHIDIVFERMPSHRAARFIDVEDSEGKSIRLEWIERDGRAVIRIAPSAEAESLLREALGQVEAREDDSYENHGSCVYCGAYCGDDCTPLSERIESYFGAGA